MNLIVVDRNEFRVSNALQDALVTYDVDSSIVVALYDPAVPAGGLLRFTEPDSRADAARSRQMPARYADSGVAALLNEIYRLGGTRPGLTVRLAGGADTRNAGTGKRNYLAVRKNLWKLGVFVQSEAVGGHCGRNVRLEIDTGRFWASETDAAGASPQDHVLKGASECPTES